MKILKLSQFQNIKVIKTQGSGKIFVGFLKGEKYYIKEVVKDKGWNVSVNDYGNYDFELLLNEILAGRIYNEVYRVPTIELFFVVNNTGLRMQRFLISSKELSIDSCQKYTIDCKNLYNNTFQFTIEPFLVDCIVANWDVAADGNIGVIEYNESPQTKRKTKIAFRLDVGGALKYRALGGTRNYVSLPNEHVTMLSRENISSSLFHSITVSQVKKMLTILHNADLTKLTKIRRDMLSSMKRVLNEHELLKVKRLFDDIIPILRKRHMFYIKNQNDVIKVILSSNHNRDK